MNKKILNQKNHSRQLDARKKTEAQSTLSNIKKGLDEVSLFKKGKLKTTSARDFLEI